MNYAIINVDTIQKRIDELEDYTYATQNVWLEGKNAGELKVLEEILSNSIPLIPEIENSYEMGRKCGRGDLDGYTKQDYINNLKLNV